MKRFLTSVAIAFFCGILIVPVVDARDGHRPSHNSQTSVGHNYGGGRGGGRPTNPGRPNNPGNHGSGRPDNPGRPNNPGNHGSGRPDNPGRPNNPGNHGSGRPDNPGRPNNPGNHGSGRPDNPGRPGYRPNTPPPTAHRPGAPGYMPGHHHHGPATPPPGRPMPPPRPWTPPRPPRGWRPAPMAPRFSTVLGITFGSALNLSLNYLLSNGYSVYSYGNDVVYINNVNQLNYLWPSAALYYGKSGLNRGEFIYSTNYYDTSRYNNVYSSLTAAYGAPVGAAAITNGMQTTWFGYDGRFVTLQYQPQYGADGIMRYYTTLTFGY